MRTFLLAAGFLAVAASAMAHGFLHERIVEAGAEIAKAPTAEAYSRRAELERLHGDFEAALKDYDEAARRAPERRDIDLGRARLYETAGQWDKALASADRFLATTPGHGSALATKARALAALGHHAEAAEVFREAIAHHEQPDPDLYVERARALEAMGSNGAARAVASLDDGMERLGPAVSLALEAIRIETAAGQFDAALVRIDAQMVGSPRREVWLDRKADVLLAAGRPLEARKACETAVEEIGKLPQRLRASTSTQSVLTRLRTKLDGMKAGTSKP